ncbi:MAG: AAA family ATPase [Firmicutes bacterium]|nr:AAA family ATPase [Bacillota bacterium]MCM1401526.1 AAA family ATPase [Bacteroides sp.]MCM1476572.1 AAA family ATPase [Bacteroides sp.]
MLYRKATQYIEEFYRSSRNALLLTGARQTGKTYSARMLGKQFKNFIELNFVEHPEAVNIFENVTSADEILLRLSAITSTPMTPGETLIFFDEVQKCENLITAIKFLVDDGRFRYILSGSLLGVELKNIRSQPVGYMSIKEVFPLDFEEFIINMGVSATVRNTLRDCWENHTAVDPMVHDKMMQLFRLYLVVGGMPAAVAEYKESNNVNNVMRVQQDIVALYRMDISQYAQKDKLKIKEIFDLLPSELDAKNKRFILKNLNEHAKFSRYEDSFLWLKDAGVVIPVYNVDEPKPPLKLAETRNLFKLFSNDVGLLAAQYADGIQLKILTGDSSLNIGAVYENVVAEELISHGVTPYYYNNKRRGEVDFIASINDKVMPIEVKSGKDYQKHTALDNLMTDYPNTLYDAVVLCNGNVETVGNITYAPIYMIMFIQRKEAKIGVYRVDLDGLM